MERSHDKMRPSLPRSKDLRLVDTVRKPTEGRGPGGRFAPRNRIAVDSGEVHATKKLLGGGATEGDAALVARDGRRLLFGALRDLPSDGSTVRTLATLYARHAAVCAYFAAKADAAGLDTANGLAFDERATKHGARAERLAVTMLDVATRLAAARKSDPDEVPVGFERVPSGGT